MADHGNEAVEDTCEIRLKVDRRFRVAVERAAKVEHTTMAGFVRSAVLVRLRQMVKDGLLK